MNGKKIENFYRWELLGLKLTQLNLKTDKRLNMWLFILVTEYKSFKEDSINNFSCFTTDILQITV